MRALPVAIALLLAPLAFGAAGASTCVTAFGPCVGEHEYGDPSCGHAGTTGGGTTTASAFGASAHGARACGTDPSGGTYEYTSVAAGVSTPFGQTYVDWADENGDCHTFVVTQPLGRADDLGCPAGGPVDPGWGRLLP